MKFCNIWLSTVGMPLLFNTVNAGVSQGAVVEYCAGDDFQPECAAGAVIVIQSARYGHIQLGKCIDVDLGKFGCLTDQLKYLDEECSGKSKCDISVADKTMGSDLTCATAYVRYLEASYICRNVEQTINCNVLPVKSSAHYLSNSQIGSTNCGKESTPIILEAKPGQKINVSLVDFNSNSIASGSLVHHKCPIRYGYIIDITHNIVHDICGRSERMKHVYLSEGNSLQVVLSESSDAKYLLRYSASGCPTYRTSPDSWSKQDADVITVGCKQSEKTWKMRCIGNNWIGLAGNCTKGVVESPATKLSTTEDKVFGMPPVIAMTLIAGVFIVIISILVTTMLGFFCIRKAKPIDKCYFAPMELMPAPQIHQHESRANTATLFHEKASINTAAMSCPQYFVLEQAGGKSQIDPVYDAVYQNITDA